MKNRTFILLTLPMILGSCANAQEVNRSYVNLKRDVLPCDKLEYTPWAEGYQVSLKRDYGNTIVVIPETYNDKPVVRIAEYGFDNCQYLEKIYIPYGLRTLGINSFRNCTALKMINLPYSVTYIEEGSFDGVDNASFMFGRPYWLPDEYIALLHWSNNMIFNAVDYIYNDEFLFAITEVNYKQSATLMKVLGDKSTYSIPRTVTYLDKEIKVTGICHNALRGHEESLEEINIPSTVDTIGKEAFLDLKNLKNVRIPSSVTNMGENVFKGCSSLAIRCDLYEQPSTWNPSWNPDNRPVTWKSK